MVMPWSGFMVGWRDEVTHAFRQPESPRSESIVLDAVRVASAEIDATVLTLGSIWDFAGPSLILAEAGGVFRDAWGGDRFDTQTAVLTNANLLDQILARLAPLRPAQPDVARLTRTVSVPIGTDDEQAADEWRSFGIRPLHSMSARHHVDEAPPEVWNIVDERTAQLQHPFRGVTTDGQLLTGLRSLDGAPRISTKPITDAALAFLQALTHDQRQRLTFPIDAEEWRMWINVHMNHFRHGLLLEDLGQPVRDLALGLRPSMLDDCGLRAALEWHVRDATRRFGVDVQLNIQGSVDALPDRYQTCVYRVVQEALTNCVRHAKAHSIAVDVTGHDDQLDISVSDDGIGFDPARRRDGLGLRGIEERVKELGGVMVVTSAAGRGTTIAIQMPVPVPMTEVQLARVAG